MKAIIKTGGKQYLVSSGQKLSVDLLSQEKGESVNFNEVLAVIKDDVTTFGTPVISGAVVVAKIVRQYRAKKVISYKKKLKKGYTKKKGHRQYLTEVQIETISA